jgi:hypothetical protein
VKIPTKLWSTRALTNAIRLPSGDHVGLLLVPRARMNGSSPRSTGAALDAGAGVSFTRWMLPSRTKRTALPSGASAGADPAATRHAAPAARPAAGLPAAAAPVVEGGAAPARPAPVTVPVRAAQIARSAPSGWPTMGKPLRSKPSARCTAH